MTKKNILIRLIKLTFIFAFIISLFNTAFATSPPSKVSSYFTDTKYNYENVTYTPEGKLDTTTKSWVYEVIFQQNRDGSGIITVSYAVQYEYHLIPSVEIQHLNCGYTYSAGTFTVYTDSAPWCIYEYRSHITEGSSTLVDVSSSYPEKGSEPDPTAVPTKKPTAEPTATPTAEPTATPTVEPTATPTVELTATPTVEPTATHEPTVAPTIHTVESTAAPIIELTTDQPIETSIVPIYDDTMLKSKTIFTSGNITLIALLIIFALILVILIAKTKRSY